MKLLAAVISSALAAREPDAERRLEKITARASELNAFVQSYDISSDKQKSGVEKWVDRLLRDLNSIDTSKCPQPVEEDKFADEIDTIEDLCDGAGKVPSMMRSYARKFGCVEGFPKRKFLDRVIKRSHKLKKVANRAGKCNKEPKPTEPVVTDPPTTDPPATGLCEVGQYAECSDLTDAEIFFENEWTCRNCFRIRAYYGTGGGFSFNPNKEFVKIDFTENVYFTGVWSHPLKSAGRIGDSNTWKLGFKPEGNFVSGMMFDAELITADDALMVDGQWIIDGAQSCKCKEGTPEPPVEHCDDPCNGRENCETFIDSCAVVPERDNTIAQTTASAGYRVSADVKCGAVPDNWAAIAHINTGSRWDVLGDRYFALFASPEGQGEGSLKFNGPLKGGDKDMITAWPNCVEGEWNTFTVEQTYVDEHELDLTLSVDGEVIATEKVSVEDAYTGALNVDVAGDWHDAAVGFKIKNFFHMTYDAPVCEPVDPCADRDNCDTLVDSCSIVPSFNTQIGTVDGDAIYSASVDVLCRRSEDHGWQSVVHMTQGGYREDFGDRYFTIWQRDDGMLKVNAPLKGNTQFDEVEYIVSCEDNSWTNIAVKQVALEGGLLELSVFQDGNKLGSNQLHHSNAFTGPIDVYAGNAWFEPASFFRIKNFIHSSQAYEAPACDATDPCAELENCETYVDSCAIGPYRGNRLAESTGTLGFRISAEVRCTDRVAPSWENVLHVHTGTNREHFGDRYFTIWKEANKSDGIRIVAPIFGNPHHELNAYVSCSPGWHTFTVQQTESGRANMLVEILFDGDVIESQEVRKDQTYQGQLFVETSNAFAWPAAYDHLVRNFYHQDITCMDPCVDEENCQTFIDSCAATPVRRNKIGSINATVNYETSIDILCTDEMPIGNYLNIIHMTTGEPATLGDRFFMITRKNDDDTLLINIADSNKDNGRTGKFVECTPGEWNTYKVTSRQNPDWPSHTYSTVTVDDVEVHQIRQDTHTVLATGTNVDVYFSEKYSQAADAFQVKNFFHKTFDELDYEIIPVMDCREEAVCNILGEDDSRVAYKDHHVATVTAAVNYRISLDILCDAMPVGEWYNMIHMTTGEGRFFYVSQRNINTQLLVEASDPTRDSGFAGRWADCPAGEWTTITVENAQDSSDPAVTTLKFFNGDTLLHEQSAPTEDFMSGDELMVYISSPYSKNSETHQLKNFVYERFEDFPVGPLNCEEDDFCTIVGADPVSPETGNLAATVTAAKNFKFSIDIKCSHAMDFGEFKNIFHVTNGPGDGVFGSRHFAIWRERNRNKMHMAWANPKTPSGHSRNYFECNDGEWNTYTMTKRQQASNLAWTWYTLAIDGVTQSAKRFHEPTYGPFFDGEVFQVWLSRSEAGTAFEVRNFTYEKFADL